MGQVTLFHRATARVERSLDENQQARRRLLRGQDGSEVKANDLERLTAEGLTLIERRNCIDMMRDHASAEFVRHTGSTWRPRTGSMVNRQHMTAALIDSRDFLAAKRCAETEVMLDVLPVGVLVFPGNGMPQRRDTSPMAMDISGCSAYFLDMSARLLTFLAMLSIVVGMTFGPAHAALVGGMVVGQAPHAHTSAVVQAAPDSQPFCKSTQKHGSGHDRLCQILCAGLSVVPATPDVGTAVVLAASDHDLHPKAWRVGLSPGPSERPPQLRLL